MGPLAAGISLGELKGEALSDFRTFSSWYSLRLVFCILAEQLEVDLRIILVAIVVAGSNLCVFRQSSGQLWFIF